jgi:invasion protein IalB
MDDRIALARPLGRALSAVAAAAALVALLMAPSALAQQPKPPAKPAPKAAPAKPAQAQPPAQPQQAQQEQAAPQLMYSPWLKVCGKGPETNNRQVCVLTKDGRLENGMPVAIVQLFEPEGEPNVLRFTGPIGKHLQHGTRMIIDQEQPAQQPYKICFPVGCMSDYPVTDEMLEL